MKKTIFLVLMGISFMTSYITILPYSCPGTCTCNPCLCTSCPTHGR